LKPLWPDSGGVPPQHRQLPDAYAEELVAASFEASVPTGWGVSKLDVERDGTVIRVSAFEGRFPSGICVFLPPGQTLTRIVPKLGDGVVSLDVGLAKAQVGVPCVAEDVAVRTARHLRARGYLQPNLCLLLGDEGGDSFERLPVARFLHGKPDKTFSPPLSRIPRRSTVADSVRAVVAALRERQNNLLRSRVARPLNLRTFDSTAAPQLSVLSAINQALAVLGDELPPRVLHEVLVDLLGCLNGLLGDLAPIHSYVHEAPGPGYDMLTRRLLEVIPTVARDPHLAFPLERRDQVTFALELRDPDAFRRGVYLVASGADEHLVSALLPAYAKLASSALLPSIVRQAIRGVPIALDFDAPPSLPSSSKHCCFKVDTRSDLWRDVLDQRSLMVHVPDAPRDLALTAYVLT
jgi:predicted component of type VI protein secretion system